MQIFRTDVIFLVTYWLCKKIVQKLAHLTLMKLTAGLNFTNILTLSFYTRRSQKCKKMTTQLTVFFMLLDSTSVKDVCRTLMKLSPDMACDILTHTFSLSITDTEIHTHNTHTHTNIHKGERICVIIVAWRLTHFSYIFTIGGLHSQMKSKGENSGFLKVRKCWENKNISII